ncbi:MAG: methyltransferase domain-containing protein [Rhodospirillaceae bacterium]|nr:methyltransferase domain-containing protein [Rhodospirillaceae bacterium]
MSPSAAALVRSTTEALATAPVSVTPGQRLAQINIGTLPQPWDTIGRHVALPEVSLDDRARLDNIAHLNHFLSQVVVPGLRRRYETDGVAGFEAAHGRAPATRDEARAVLEATVQYQAWSRLRRGSMEQRQKIAADAVADKAEAISAACAGVISKARNLELDPSLEMPAYLVDTHAHLMPGGYTAQRIADDASTGAMYEIGVYSTVPGRSGPHSDGAGRAIANWLKTRFPTLQPKRIFDLGCGAGLNTVAVAKAFPDAEIIAIDAAAPMLRYAAARAHALGIKNVRFVQADIEHIPARLGKADVAFSAIVLHETSHQAVKNIFKSCFDCLSPNGLTAHVEQPPYEGKPLFEQVMRDWDGQYNNEAFWSGLYALDLGQELAEAGFAQASIFTDDVSAVPWRTDATVAGKAEDYGRTGNWKVYGAFKA